MPFLDPGLYGFCTDRQREVLEAINREEGFRAAARAMDSILAGDGDYPANWQRILDVCRQEIAGDSAAGPFLFWGIHND